MQSRQRYIETNLFYAKHSNELAYTTEPTGRPSIDKIAIGDRECWEDDAGKQGSLKNKDRKKIIVTDFMLTAFSLYESKKRFAVLEQLIEEGFQLYYCAKDLLITIEQVADLYSHSDLIYPHHPDDVIQIAINCKIEKHECYVLETFQLDQFVNNNFDTFLIQAKKLVKFEDKPWYSEVLKRLAQLDKVILSIEHSDLEDEDVKEIYRLGCNHFIGYAIETYASAFNEQELALVKEIFSNPNVKQLHLHTSAAFLKHTSNLNEPTLLKQLDVFEISASEKVALHYIRQMPALKRLSIDLTKTNGQEVDKDLRSELLQLKHLESLSMTISLDGDLDISYLYELSKQCKNLQSLALNNFTIIANDNTINRYSKGDGQLAKLERLEIIIGNDRRAAVLDETAYCALNEFILNHTSLKELSIIDNSHQNILAMSDSETNGQEFAQMQLTHIKTNKYVLPYQILKSKSITSMHMHGYEFSLYISKDIQNENLTKLCISNLDDDVNTFNDSLKCIQTNFPNLTDLALIEHTCRHAACDLSLVLPKCKRVILQTDAMYDFAFSVAFDEVFPNLEALHLALYNTKEKSKVESVGESEEESDEESDYNSYGFQMFIDFVSHIKSLKRLTLENMTLDMDDRVYAKDIESLNKSITALKFADCNIDANKKANLITVWPNITDVVNISLENDKGILAFMHESIEITNLCVYENKNIPSFAKCANYQTIKISNCDKELLAFLHNPTAQNQRVSQTSNHARMHATFDDGSAYTSNTREVNKLVLGPIGCDVHPAYYRISILNAHNTNGGVFNFYSTIKPINIKSVSRQNEVRNLLKTYNEELRAPKPDNNYFYAEPTFIDAAKWTPAITLTAQDQLVDCQYTYDGVVPPNGEVLIGYDMNTKQVYVKTNLPGLIQLHYIFLSPWRNNSNHKLIADTVFASENEAFDIFKKQLRFSSTATLNANDAYNLLMSLSKTNRLLLLAKYILRTFDGTKNLKNPPFDKLTLPNAFLKERVGACRHFADLYYLIAQAIDCSNEVMMILNQLHQFVQIHIDGEWFAIDLGGKPMQLIVNEMANPYEQINSSATNQLDPNSEDHLNSNVNNNNVNSSINNNNALAPSTTVNDDMDIEMNKIVTAHKAKNIELKPGNRFMVWQKQQLDDVDINIFIESLFLQLSTLPTNIRNAAIYLKDEHEIVLFQAALARYAKTKGRDYHYVHSLNRVSYKDTRAIDNKVSIIDSHLITALRFGDANSIYIWNFSEFERNHVGFNTIIDSNRRRICTGVDEDDLDHVKIDEVDVPDGSCVIILLPNAKRLEMGEDFSTRCKIEVEFNKHLPSIETYLDQEQANDYPTAECYNTSSFQTNLMGRLRILAKNYMFDEGALLAAIHNKALGINLINAPESLYFQQFLINIMIQRKIVINGDTIEIPEHFKFYRTKRAYDFSQAQYQHVCQVEFDADLDYQLELNHETFQNFFNNYIYVDGLSESKGWLKDLSQKTITILVTASFEANAWQHLFVEAAKYGCNLTLTAYDNNLLPAGIAKRELDDSIYQKNKVRKLTNNQHQIIQTNDIDYAEAALLKKLNPTNDSEIKKTIRVIPVTTDTLFSQIVAGFDLCGRDLQSFYFIESAIWKLLMDESGKTIILRGSISDRLAQQLSSLFGRNANLFVNGRFVSPAGRLVIITTQPHLVKHQDCIIHQNVVDANRYELLSLDPDMRPQVDYIKIINDAFDLKLNYRQMHTILHDLHKSYSRTLKSLFLDTEHESKIPLILNMLQMDKESLGILKTKTQTNIMEKRAEQIWSELELAPYVFILGATGIGKSTMISYLKNKETNVKFYFGFDQLSAWANDDELHQKILVIDEANTYPQAKIEILWSLYTGNITIGPDLVALDHFHKGIFLGNPKTYGGGRESYTLFNNNGHKIIFKDLPQEYLEKEVVGKLLHELVKLPEPWLDALAQLYVRYYIELKDKFSLAIPVTMRNLQMCCMRFADMCKRHSAALTQFDHVLFLAKIAFYLETRNLFESKMKLDKNRFKLQVFETELAVYRQWKRAGEQAITLEDKNFIASNSHRKYLFRLQQQINILANRIEQSTQNNSIGTRGILFEGASGIGKSSMAVSYLESLEYMPASLAPPDFDTRKTYVQITPTHPKIMEAILHEAFHQGRIVIIDELNILPIEGILNNLLMGRDKHDKAAKKEGFFVIATQNEATFTNRRISTLSQLNRYEFIKMKCCNADDLKEILEKRYPKAPKVEVKEMVDEYMDSANYADQHRIKPKPTPRSLFHVAKQTFPPK